MSAITPQIQRLQTCFAIYLIFAVLTSTAAAWVPGTSQPQAASGFQVDTSDRTDVLSFYHTIYRASEGAQARMQWTGDVGTGIAGTTSTIFKNDVLRRINFFRALVGVSADVALADAKNSKSQQAALMMAANNQMSHFPPASWLFYSADGAEAAGKANLFLGQFGPSAIDGYIEDPGSNNFPVGHRRWILYANAREMGTGDIPAIPNRHSAANALWVIGDFSTSNTPRFIAWPNAGFVPDHLVTDRWSLGYAGANFSSAVVTMSRDGIPVPVNVVSRSNTGFGENTIVWEPVGLPKKPVAADVTFLVQVTGIGGAAGVPTSHAYSVTMFNPAQLGQEVIISGPAAASLSGQIYTFTPVRGADAYELRTSVAVPGVWGEDAEDASASTVVDGTADSYSLRQAQFVLSGSNAFQLAFPSFADGEQKFTISREVVPKAGSELVFHEQFRWATTGSRLSAEVSTDEGLSWSEVWGRNGSGSWDAGFSRRAVSMAPFAGKPVLVRFVFRFNGSTFLGTSINHGVFIDSISMTQAVEISSPTRLRLPATASFFTFAEPAVGAPLVAGRQYFLSVRPQVGTVWMPAGPLKTVTAANAAPVPPPDSVPPVLTISSRNSISTNASSLTIHGSATDDVSPVQLQYRLRAPASTSYEKWQTQALPGSAKLKNWTQAIGLPQTGKWVIQFRVRDAAGNRSAAVTQTIVVDRTLPRVAVASPTSASAAIRAQRFSLRGTATDDRAPNVLEYRVQPPGSSYTKWQRGTLTGTGKSRSWSQAVDLPTEGAWQVQVRVADAAGNRSVAVTRTIVVDRTAPTVVVSTPSGGRVSTSKARFTLKGTASDNMTAVRLDFRVRRPGGSYGAWEPLDLSGSAIQKSWERQVSVNALGEWRVQIRAADRAGNLSGARTIIINRR